MNTYSIGEKIQWPDIKKFIKTIDANWWSLWQVMTIYEHLIFGRVSININYCLTASGHAFKFIQLALDSFWWNILISTYLSVMMLENVITLQLKQFLYVQMQWFFFCRHSLLFDGNFKFSYHFLGKLQLMNEGNIISSQYQKVTVRNLCMPQFDLYQTQTPAC